MKVYLDQNVFADLDGRVPNAAVYVNKLRDSIQQGQIIIVPGVELFEEL